MWCRFGEAVVSPLGAGGASGTSGARFTFVEAGGAGAGAASHHDTHADLAAALPPPHPHPALHSDSRELA